MSRSLSSIAMSPSFAVPANEWDMGALSRASPMFFCRRKLISRPLPSAARFLILSFLHSFVFTLCSRASCHSLQTLPRPSPSSFSHFSRPTQFLTSREEFVSQENVHRHQPHICAKPRKYIKGSCGKRARATGLDTGSGQLGSLVCEWVCHKMGRSECRYNDGLVFFLSVSCSAFFPFSVHVGNRDSGAILPFGSMLPTDAGIKS